MEETEIKKLLHEALIFIKSRVDYPDFGICSNVWHYINNNYNHFRAYTFDLELIKLIDNWPNKFIGDDELEGMQFPVGGAEEYSRGNLWKNPRRIELLDWLIEQTKE